MLFCPFAKVEPVVLKIKIDHLVLMLLSKFKFGTHFKAKHERKKDCKVSLVYFLVTKISKCKLKVQLKSIDRCRSRVHIEIEDRKEIEARNFLVSI